MTNVESGIAKRLRIAREQAGLSQGQVARLLSLHRPAVTEIEAGRRRVSAEELDQLARLYHVSLDWLVRGDAGNNARNPAEIAARKFANLRPEELDRLIQLLTTLRLQGQDEERGEE